MLRSPQDPLFGDAMKRFAVFLLLDQRRIVRTGQRRTRKQEYWRKQPRGPEGSQTAAKSLEEDSKKQRKAMKKYQKQQRRAAAAETSQVTYTRRRRNN